MDRTITDRLEITDLVSRLGLVFDEGRFDEMPSLFVADAVATTPGGTARGRDAVVAQAGRNHRPDQHIQHVTSNVLVDLDGDRARVRANLVVTFAEAGAGEALAPPPEFTLGEVYRFEVVRTPDGWRFARVETTPVWMSGRVPAVPGAR